MEETSSQVVIDFTPPESEPEPTPVSTPAPEPEPVYSEPDGGEYQAETGGGGGETGGGSDNGVVHDPVFGDVVPGQAQQQEVDNDGDPDKQVGIM